MIWIKCLPGFAFPLFISTIKSMNLKPASLFVSLVLLSIAAHAQQANRVVQFNIDPLLNARPVTTITNGKLTSWTKGIDGNGDGDGYLTMSASIFHGDKSSHALPDDPLIAATSMHPPILLHYDNKDSVNYQARYVAGEGEFGFKIPGKKYSDIYLCFTSAEGPSVLEVELSYWDGIEIKVFKIPDYYNDIAAGDPNQGYLLHDLAKWGKNDVMTENNHHNIDVLNIHPDPKRVLNYIGIKKAKGGFLVFWAAAGVVN